MSILKSLEIVPEENGGNADPFQAAKSKLISNLETQLKCAEAMVKGEAYMLRRMETVDEDGVKVRKPVRRPVRHWYWRDSEGKVRISVRVFNKRLEIEKGKTDVVVGDDKQLPKTVGMLINATKAGEFDAAIKQIIAERAQRKSK